MFLWIHAEIKTWTGYTLNSWQQLPSGGKRKDGNQTKKGKGLRKVRYSFGNIFLK